MATQKVDGVSIGPRITHKAVQEAAVAFCHARIAAEGGEGAEWANKFVPDLMKLEDWALKFGPALLDWAGDLADLVNREERGSNVGSSSVREK